MTLIVSITHPKGIVMASDSYFITTSRSETGTGEYAGEEILITTVEKIYEIPGIGCLSFWGNWPVRNPKPRLQNLIQTLHKQTRDVEDASFKLLRYLENEICPNDRLGFHLGGFSSDRLRKLYHVFYGTQWNEPGKDPDYHRNEEDVGAEQQRYRILYNGEPRVTADVIRFLRLFQEELRVPVFPGRYDIDKAVEFAVFLIRYTHDQMAQTCAIPTVGGRINIAIINHDNSVNWETRDPKRIGKPEPGSPLQGETGATVPGDGP